MSVFQPEKEQRGRKEQWDHFHLAGEAEDEAAHDRASAHALPRGEQEQPREDGVHVAVKAGDHEIHGAQREKDERPDRWRPVMFTPFP